MMMKFKYGFFYKNILYGWHKKTLYRLPQKIGLRFYSLKKMKQIIIGNNVGYQLSNNRKTIDQLENFTIVINKEVSKILDNDVPFQ
jgi:hypothetical protein